MKAFNVLLITKNPNSSIRVKQTLRGLGKVVEEEPSVPYVFAMVVLPTNQDNTCATIRNLIRADIDVFADKVFVSVVDQDYVSYINWIDGETLLKDEASECKEKRNFERFRTRHEAFVAFELEKPKWVYDDGVNMGITMKLDDWCWLPVKGDGVYERSKYEKYILG